MRKKKRKEKEKKKNIKAKTANKASPKLAGSAEMVGQNERLSCVIGTVTV